MANINDTTTYPNTTPALNDHVPGTDVSDTGNSADGETVTFLLSGIRTLFGHGDISSGTGAPATTPGKIGDVYIDTAGPAFYFAKGTASSADWVESLSAASGLVLPTVTSVGADGLLLFDDSDSDDPKQTTITTFIADNSITLTSDITGQQHLYVPATSMVSRTTSGAAAGSTELATNDVMIESFDFDTGADEFVQFSLQMPKNWDEGTIIAQAIWSHPSTATNFGVTWAVQALALADGDAGDTAFGTAVTIDDTGGTTDDIYISPESAAITVAGTPGAEEWVVVQVYRDVSDANDDLAVDARLHGLKIHFTTDALNNN